MLFSDNKFAMILFFLTFKVRTCVPWVQVATPLKGAQNSLMLEINFLKEL